MKSGIHRWNFFGSQILTASSGREFESSRRSDFLKEIGISANSLALVRQVHGNEIKIVESLEVYRKVEADGLITSDPSIALGILTADCLPVFLYAPPKGIGLLHVGWRGLQKGIISKGIQMLIQKYQKNPQSISVGFGPAIHKCCYEVGEEFSGYFPDFYFPPKDGANKGRMDLITAASAECQKLGIPLEQIHDCGICTVCRNDLFFSARREKTDERILSVIKKMI